MAWFFGFLFFAHAFNVSHTSFDGTPVVVGFIWILKGKPPVPGSHKNDAQIAEFRHLFGQTEA